MFLYQSHLKPLKPVKMSIYIILQQKTFRFKVDIPVFLGD